MLLQDLPPNPFSNTLPVISQIRTKKYTQKTKARTTALIPKLPTREKTPQSCKVYLKEDYKLKEKAIFHQRDLLNSKCLAGIWRMSLSLRTVNATNQIAPLVRTV